MASYYHPYDKVECPLLRSESRELEEKESTEKVMRKNNIKYKFEDEYEGGGGEIEDEYE